MGQGRAQILAVLVIRGLVLTPRTPTHRRRRASSRLLDSVKETEKARAKLKHAVPYAADTDAALEPRGVNVVRSEQMDLSPGMQLPLMARRTKSTDLTDLFA